MKLDTHYHEGVSAYTYSDKKQKTRSFKDFEIRSYKDEDIIAGIKEHYPDDIENSIIKFDLVSKYLITDKNVLYATHNFTRGYTSTEKAEYKNARLKAEEYKTKLNIAEATGCSDKKSLTRWKKKRQEYLNTCYAIDTGRKQKRLTRLSDRSTVAVSFNDTSKADIAFDEDNRSVKHQTTKDVVEALGYTVKEYTNHFKVKEYDVESRTFKTSYIEYTGFYFLINRNALITSILQGELCHKGKVWQDGLQISIRRGRPYPSFVFQDNKGDIHSYDTMKEAATEHFETSAKTLQRSLKKRDGNTFIISGETYTLLA